MGLIIQLFGKFRVWREGEEEPISKREWQDRKCIQLFKILVSERGRPLHIDRLTEWLWPDSDPERAASSLRNRVSQLRRILEPGLRRGLDSRYIRTYHNQGYQFDPDTPCRIDSECFERAYQAGRMLERAGCWSDALKQYEQAAALYQGDYLSEDRYESWAAPYQEQWRGKYLRLITGIARCYALDGRCDEAIEWAERAIELAPAWSEALYRDLMRYYAARSDRAGVMRTYARLKRALAEAYQIRPSPDTERLLQEILGVLSVPCGRA